jgi:hypothetical protein
MQKQRTYLFFPKIAGKELQGKEEVHSRELKAEHVLGLKNPFMKIHTLNVYVLQKSNMK